MNNFRALTKLIFALLIVHMLIVTRETQHDNDEITKQILDTTSVKGGLIVHLDCGDAKLTKAF